MPFPDVRPGRLSEEEYARNFADAHPPLTKSQALIEFNLDGTIITANPNFLAALGYSLEEIKGKHHSMFVEPATRDSSVTP